MAVPEVTKKYKKWLDQQLEGFDCIFLSIHGSHLYGLSRPESDIDFKAVYMPSKEDLLLGKALKTYKFENKELDIELEVKSLSEFLKSASKCDTNCMDFLHTPDEYILYKKPMWDIMVQHRSNLYAKNMSGIIGYIKTHAHKYSNKIERLKELELVHKACIEVWNLFNIDADIRVGTIAEYLEDKHGNTLKYVKYYETVKGDEQKYLEVCGKKYIHTWSRKELQDKMAQEIDRYGKRSSDGLGKGLDSKSLSHALRVLYQLKELIETKTMTFPISEAQYVKDIKTGVITDKDEILERINSLFEECTEKLEKSDLPLDPDLSPMYSALSDYYFGVGDGKI